MIMRVNSFKVGYALLILLLLLLSLQYGVKVSNGGHAWKTADWLIHYDAGLVRRGFMGTFFLFLSDAFSIQAQWISYFFQVGFLGGLAFFVLKAFSRFHQVPYAIYWLWTPAFVFLFWINHTSTSFRKEVLLYLALVFMLKAFANQTLDRHSFGRQSFSRGWYGAAIVTFFIAGLSHELVIFFVPFFIFPVVDDYIRSEKKSLALLLYALPFLVSAVFIVLFALYFSATEAQVNQICHALDVFDLKENFCDGAIRWLQYDAAYGLQKVLELGWPVWLNYLFLLVLSLAPILLLERDRAFNLLIVCALLSAMPLFLVAIDYGRWISILYTSLLLTIIWLRPQLIEKGVRIRPVWIFAYCFLWVLPNGEAVFPYKGVLARLFLMPFGL